MSERRKTLVQSYLDGAPALDPAFVAARAAAYDRQHEWIRVNGPGEPIFVRAPRRIRGISVRTLESAFGSDFRPFTRSTSFDTPAIEDLLRALDAVKGWDMAELNVLSDPEADGFRSTLAGKGRFCAVFPFTLRVIAGCRTYEEYISRRGPAVNKNQRAHLQRSTRDGYVFRDALGWEDIVRVLDARQARFAGPDYTRMPQFRMFLQEFRDRLAQAGRLLEIGMFAGDTLAGFQIAFRTGPVLHMYQTAFDPAHAERRPGSLALEKAIEFGLNEDVALIDLMNDSPHLAQFATATLELRRVVCLSRTIRGAILAKAFQLGMGRSLPTI